MTPTLRAFVPDASEFMIVAPEAVVIAAALIILIIEIVPGRAIKAAIPWVAGMGLLGSVAALIANGTEVKTGFAGMMITDGFAVAIKAVLAVTGLIAIGMSSSYVKREELDQPEYYALLLFSISGMMMMASSANLIMVFLSLEILSFSLYILSGYAHPLQKSQESALKYFLLGSFASAFLLYGIALIYGATRSTELAVIAGNITEGALSRNPMLLAGVGLVTVGLGFKIAAVPFQMWTPDVYEGAPSSVTAFMSVGAKAAGFAALARVFMTAFGVERADWIPALWVIAALTMIVGNVVAIAQTNIKRMLAYSSIAHAGYILVGMVAANSVGVSALVFYLLVYTFMNLGAWAVVIFAGRKGDPNINLSDYSGLFWRQPGVASAMAVFMIALSGLPPTSGFIAKFYIFSAALQGGNVGLVIIGVITSLISVYYYLRVATLMFMQPPVETGVPERVPIGLGIVLAVTAIATLLIGVYPGQLLRLAELARIAMP